MPSPKYQGLAHTAYDADGVTTTWNFNFSGGYLDAAHVKAYTVAGDTTTFLGTVPLAGPYQALLVPAVPAGTEVHIYRDTPKDLPIVDFTDGSGLTETALDTNAKQAVFLAAEASDYAGIGSAALAVAAADSATSAASAAQASEEAAVAAAETVASFGVDATYSHEIILDGVASSWELPFAVSDKKHLDVTVSGITQNRSAYSVSGYTLSMDEAPPHGTMMVTARKTLITAPKDARVFWVDTYGAIGNGAADDTQAIQDAIDAAFLAGGGVVLFPQGLWKVSASDLLVKRNVSLVGPVNTVAEQQALAGGYSSVKAVLFLGGGRTIKLQDGASVSGLYVIENSLNGLLPLTTQTQVSNAVSGFTGTAITIDGQDTEVKNLAIFGFNQAVYSTAVVGSGKPRERHKISNVLIDCTNGVWIDRSSDVSRLTAVHCWPFLNSRVAGAALRRQGSAFKTSTSADAITFTSCFSYGWDIGFDIQCKYGTLLVNCAADGASLSGVSQVGYKFSGTATSVIMTNCMVSGQADGVSVNMTDAGAAITLTGCDFHGNGRHLISLNHGTLGITGCQFNNVWVSGSGHSVYLDVPVTSVTGIFGNSFNSGRSAFSVSPTSWAGLSADCNTFAGGTVDSVGIRRVAGGAGGVNGSVNSNTLIHNDNNTGAISNYYLSKGTPQAPTAASNGAQLFRSYGYAFDGVAYYPAASTRFQLEAAALPGQVKGKYIVSTNPGAGLVDRLEVTGDGYLRLLAIPTSPAGLPSETVWNDGGTLKIV